MTGVQTCALPICLVREPNGMECHGSVLKEWVGSVLMFGRGKMWNGLIPFLRLVEEVELERISNQPPNLLLTCTN